ncbi:uncharacterized protein LOC130657213 [Hydractinia symbiolongicarpus]|uniref:uncharacterized protein LOC130657213 n=1 Tax=Hydractinia symbiolongicarpus TaxID=13093 RepID=UPI00254B9ECA|nr:uncharacterized protein LOC130657213 [Hydractinia symbiolongicarpus]
MKIGKHVRRGLMQKISPNTVIMNQRLDKLNQELEDLKEEVKLLSKEKTEIADSLQVQKNMVDDKLEISKTHIKTREEKLKDLKEKLREMEDRSRRNNLRIDSLKEHEKESWEDCKQMVKNLLKQKLNLENIIIERTQSATDDGKSRSQNYSG